MKQQTAVEWFMEQIGEKQPNGLYVIDSLEDVKQVFEQAKEMEKEQIIDAIIISEKEHIIQGNVYPPQFVVDKAEQYYKQKYGGNK